MSLRKMPPPWASAALVLPSSTVLPAMSFRVTSPRNLLMRAVLLLVIVGGLAVLTLAFRRRRYLGLAAATMALLAVGVMTSVIMYSGLRSDMSRGLVRSMAMPTSSERTDFDAAADMDADVSNEQVHHHHAVQRQRLHRPKGDGRLVHY